MKRNNFSKRAIGIIISLFVYWLLLNLISFIFTLWWNTILVNNLGFFPIKFNQMYLLVCSVELINRIIQFLNNYFDIITKD